MPIPAPRKNENKKNFIARCMGDEVMKKEFSDIKQRHEPAGAAGEAENVRNPAKECLA